MFASVPEKHGNVLLVTLYVKEELRKFSPNIRGFLCMKMLHIFQI